MCKILLVAWLIAIPIWLVAGVAYGQPPTKVDDLEVAKSAWQRRHDLARTVRATLTEEVTIHREYYMIALPGRKPVVPDQDIQDAYTSTVTLKGNNFKFAYTSNEWSPVTKSRKPTPYLAISNSNARSFFFDHGQDSEQRPQLSRSNRSDSDELLLKLIPLMLTIRSKQPHHRQLADYSRTGETISVGGRACVEIITGSRSGQYECMYLDPSRDWVVCRIDGYANGKLKRRLEIQHEADPVVGWLPSTWTYVALSAEGTPLNSGQVKDVKYEINIDLNDDEFDPKYPPGTFVVDASKQTNKETMLSIIRSDGSPGVGIPLSQNPTETQLLLANDPPHRSWRRLSLFGSLLLVGLFAVLWSLRRRHSGGQRLEKAAD